MKWNEEKIKKLAPSEVRQLKDNAERRGRDDVVRMCEFVLADRQKFHVESKTKAKKRNGSRLVSRSKAFEMRGVTLRNKRWSWGGVRESDGAVVLTMWADSIVRQDGNSRYLLWAANTDGSRPWSDNAGGKERLRHCKLALEQGEAEGILIYGERRGKDLPPESSSKVHGADGATVIRFRVEQDGNEFWAVWQG